ncbi:MAG: sigma-70 family RNA polymerase sigma factor [Cyclobacteriaceae bacterium]|nr:sigma-70 family RNA polymerase sigma factor [Cyclobacteriaceae bacterium]
MVQQTEDVHLLIGHLFRHEAGKMAAVLTRFLGVDHLDAAEDLVQDTLLKAMETWRFRGMPDNPTAWLYKVARNKAIDWVREQQRKTKNSKENESTIIDWNSAPLEEIFHEEEIQDSVLRMMFTCCHPHIQPESQIALTLKTLGGLSVVEIANAFLTTEDTIAKRIYRAKEKIKLENIKFDPPGVYETPARLYSVLHVLYLLFNEGYHSSHGDTVIREDLCAEAMRLAYLLVQHKSTNLPKVNALLALMCLQSSRFTSRIGDLGQIILLEDQDRTKWNQELIKKGLNFLEQSSTGDVLSEYHVEASIASVHALAKRFEDTHWHALVKLYEILNELKPGPMTSLNRAIAMGYAYSPQKGIDELEKIESLKDHYLHLCAIGNFYLLNENKARAKFHFEKALQKTTSIHEQELLKRNIEKCN